MDNQITEENQEDLTFLEEKDSTSEDTLTSITIAAHTLINIRKDIALAEEQLKIIKKDEVKLSQEEIPNLLLEKGLTSITLESGEKIEITDDLQASLPKDPIKRKIILKWIIANGGSGIIKEEVRIEEPENNLITFLQEMDIPYEKILDIHHSTLRAFYKSKLGMTKGSLQEVELQDIPKEANVFVYKKTKIK